MQNQKSSNNDNSLPADMFAREYSRHSAIRVDFHNFQPSNLKIKKDEPSLASKPFAYSRPNLATDQQNAQRDIHLTDPLIEKINNEFRKHPGITSQQLQCMILSINTTLKFWFYVESKMDGNVGTLTTDDVPPQPQEIPWDLEWDPDKEKDIMFTILQSVCPETRESPFRVSYPQKIPHGTATIPSFSSDDGKDEK